MGTAFVNIGGFLLPGIAGFQGYPVWTVATWAFVFSIVTGSKAFRAFAGLQAPPDTSSVKYTMIVVRWLFCLVLMLVAYGVGWGLAKVF